MITWCSSSDFCMYDPRYRTWAKLTSMRRSRVSFPLVASDKGLYAIAGVEHMVDGVRDIETYLSSVEFYDPHSNTWSSLPQLPFGVFSCAAVCLGGSVYTCGGITSDPEDNVPSQQLRVFDGHADEWRSLAPMQVPRQAHAMTVLGQKSLVVFGGYTDVDYQIRFEDCFDNELYDIETDQWSLLNTSPIEVRHLHNSVATHNGGIFILGGSAVTSQRFIHKYDAEKDVVLEGQPCGQSVKKLVSLRVSLAPEWFENPEDDDDAGAYIN